MKNPQIKAITIAVLYGINSGISHAADAPQAQPLAKIGQCPSGYSSNGSYCVPNMHARFAIEKTRWLPQRFFN